MARRIVGLDLGAYSVKLLRLEVGKQHPRFEVLEAWEEVLPDEEPEGPDLLERQRLTLASLLQNNPLEAETYAIGLPAIDGNMLTMAVPFSETRKIEAVLPGLLEAEVPFDLAEMSISWHSIEKYKNNESEGSQIRIAFGKKQSIAATLQMLHSVGVDPRLMLLSASAPYELVRDLGFEPFSYQASLEERDDNNESAGAIIDFGHRATNVCIFDCHGLKLSLSFLRGGKKLSEEIVKEFQISFKEAQALKHEKMNLEAPPQDEVERKLQAIGVRFFADLGEQLARIILTSGSSGHGAVKAVAFIGGGARTLGLDSLMTRVFSSTGSKIITLDAIIPNKIPMPSMAMAFAYALGCLHVHAKDSRFNFRKDEFAWRGELDFLRQNSVSLVLWGLVFICSLTILWASNSMVLNKENQVIETKLRSTCATILQQSNLPAKKCLAQMKEQISSRDELGIPDFTAADVYVKIAEGIPTDVNIVISEMEILEKKVRLVAESKNFADIDNVMASIKKIPCFVHVENFSRSSRWSRRKI